MPEAIFQQPLQQVGLAQAGTTPRSRKNVKEKQQHQYQANNIHVHNNFFFFRGRQSTSDARDRKPAASLWWKNFGA
eukprot:6152867-Amphidinium_carterae.1